MEHTARELGSYLFVFSEIPRSPPDDQWWVSSADGKAAVALNRTAMLAATDTGRGPGYTFMQFPGLLVFSCYWRPGGPLHEFEGFLSGLNATLRNHVMNDMTVIIAGDFNAKSPTWGSTTEDSRGEVLGTFAAAWRLWLKNVGSTLTFAVGGHTLVIDVTLARYPMGSSVRGWRVRNDVFSDSDHFYIQYSLSLASPPPRLECRHM